MIPTEPLDLDLLEAERAFAEDMGYAARVNTDQLAILIAAARQLDVVTAERDAAMADAEVAWGEVKAVETTLLSQRDRLSTLTARNTDLTALLGEALKVLDLGERLVDYFGNERTIFYGGGSCPEFLSKSKNLIAKINEAVK